MKKILTLVVSLILILALSVNVYANPLCGDSGDYQTMNYHERDAVFQLADLDARCEITDELLAEVGYFRNQLESLQGELGEYQPTSRMSYDYMSREAILDMHDGLTAIEISKIGIIHAGNAKNEARDLYEDLGLTVEMKRDAFRHMTWNFRSAKDVGVAKTRIATINHEWIYIIIDNVNAYEAERYNYYLFYYYDDLYNGFKTDSDIQLIAQNEADAYAITYRDALIASCQSSYSTFNAVFNESSYIMDFWNNNVGRNYAQTHSSLSTTSVFELAWNAGELIKHEGSAEVTNTRRYTVFQSNYWRI